MLPSEILTSTKKHWDFQQWSQESTVSVHQLSHAESWHSLLKSTKVLSSWFLAMHGIHMSNMRSVTINNPNTSCLCFNCICTRTLFFLQTVQIKQDRWHLLVLRGLSTVIRVTPFRINPPWSTTSSVPPCRISGHAPTPLFTVHWNDIKSQLVTRLPLHNSKS